MQYDKLQIIFWIADKMLKYSIKYVNRKFKNFSNNLNNLNDFLLHK
jgi:hypothetical protein